AGPGPHPRRERRLPGPDVARGARAVARAQHRGERTTARAGRARVGEDDEAVRAGRGGGGVAHARTVLSVLRWPARIARAPSSSTWPPTCSRGTRPPRRVVIS